MVNRRFVLLLTLLVVIILSVLNAKEKKQSQFISSNARGKLSVKSIEINRHGLIEKLNNNPEYSNLTARQKVTVIVEEFRKKNRENGKAVNKIELKKEMRLNNKIRVNNQNKLQVN